MDPATLNNKGTEPEINPEIQKDHEKKGKKALLWLVGKVGAGLGKVGLGSSIFATKAGVVGLLAMGTVTAGGIGYFGAPVLKKIVSTSTMTRRVAPDNPFISQNAAQQGTQGATQARGGGVSHLQSYQEGLIPAAEGDYSQSGQSPEEGYGDSPSAGADQPPKLAPRGFGAGERISAGGGTSGAGTMEPPSPVAGDQPSGTRGNIQSMQRGSTGRVTRSGGRSLTSQRGGGSIGALRAAAKTSQMATQMSAPEAASQTAYQALGPGQAGGNVEEMGSGLQPQGAGGLTQGANTPKVSSTVKDIKPAESDSAGSDPRPWEKDIARARMLLYGGLGLLAAAIIAGLVGRAAFLKAKLTVAGGMIPAAQSIVVAAQAVVKPAYAVTPVVPLVGALEAAIAKLAAAKVALASAVGASTAALTAGPEAAAIAGAKIVSLAHAVNVAALGVSTASDALKGGLLAVNDPFFVAPAKTALAAVATSDAAVKPAVGTITGTNTEVNATFAAAKAKFVLARKLALGAAAAGAAVTAIGVGINSKYDQGPSGTMWITSGSILTVSAGTFWYLNNAAAQGKIYAVLLSKTQLLIASLAAGGGSSAALWNK